MANGKRELIEDISDIRRLAGLAEAPKKAAPAAANPDPNNYGSFSTNNNSPYGFAQGGSSDDTAANFFASDKRMRDAQAQQAAPTPKAAAPKPAAPKPAAPKATAPKPAVTPPSQRNTTGGVAPEIPTARYDMPDNPTDTEKALGYPQGGPPQAKTSPQGSIYAPPKTPGIDTTPQPQYRIPGSNIANPGVQKPTQSITNQPPVTPNPSSPKIDPKILSPDYVEPGFGPNDAEQFKPVPPAPRPQPFNEPKTFTPPDKKPAAGGLDAPPQINPYVDNMPVQQFKGPNTDPGMDATNKLPKIEPFKGDMGDSFTGSAGSVPKAAVPAPKPQALNTVGAGTSADFADKDPSTMKDIVKELRQMAGIPEDGIPGQGIAQEAMAQFESKAKTNEGVDMEEATDPRDSRPQTWRPNNTGYAWDRLSTRSPSDDEDSKATRRGKQMGLKHSIRDALGKHGPKGKLPEDADPVEEGIEVNPINDSLALMKKLAGL